MKLAYLITITSILSGCAVMHHTQVGEIDSNVVLKGRKFEVLVSETGVNFKEGAKIGQALTRHKGTQRQLRDAQQILALFQMGPRTGNQVFSDDFADQIVSLVQANCPHGEISGLVSVRESAKYPVVSGEIVKIIGYCLEKKRGKNV